MTFNRSLCIYLFVRLTGSIRGIFGCGGAAFPGGAQDSCVIQEKIPESVISGVCLKRERMNRSVGGHRAGRVLDLIVDALGQLRGQADALSHRAKIARIRSGLRGSEINERRTDFPQRFGGARFGLCSGIALPLGNDEPEETPDRAEQHTQENAPPHQNFSDSGLCFGRAVGRIRFRQVRAAMRAQFGGLIDFILAFAAGVHGLWGSQFRLSPGSFLPISYYALPQQGQPAPRGAALNKDRLC